MSSESSEDSLIEEDSVIGTSATETPSCSVSETPSCSVTAEQSEQPPSDYGTYINIIEDSEEEEEDNLLSAIVASIEDQT